MLNFTLNAANCQDIIHSLLIYYTANNIFFKTLVIV